MSAWSASNGAQKLIAVAALIGFSSAEGLAAIVDLVNGTNGTANGALFYRADFQPAGTGVLNSFVRVQHDNGPSNNDHSPEGEQQGYNTSGRPVQYDELTDPNYTRNLRFSEIPVVEIAGVPYKEFILDINEPNGNGANLLSLDQVHIYTSPTGSQIGLESTLGTLRYSLGAFLDENVVTLDYDLNSGSGQGDMRMYVPLANFAGTGANEFVYLYSYFGHLSEDHETGAGFEEWAVIPEPSAAALLGLGVLCIARRRGN